MKLFAKSLLLLTIGATLAGCGGGNGSSSFNPTPVPTGVAPTGKTVTRAILTSGYQSFHAAINYPYAGLQLALPASSPFRVGKNQRLAKGALNVTSPAQFNPDLNLYETVATNANVTTIKFYSDAALTKSAGNSVLTAPANQSVGSNYVSYPAIVKITQNITAGNIPCQGSGTITFSGGSGANKLDGTLSLPKTGLKVTANLTLSDTGQVGGSTTIVGNGQTVTLSRLSGQIDGDLTGKANVLPDKTTGTGVVNVLTGKFEITLATPQGTATGVGNSDGSLGIHFPDGLAEKLASPLAIIGGQDPTAPTATATPTAKPTATPKPAPTSVPGTTIYNAPVKIQTNSSLVGLNNRNRFLANIAGANGIRFYSNPADNGQTLPGSAAAASIGATGFNDNDATVGTDLSGNSASALFWSSPSAALTKLKLFSSGNNKTFPQALNDSGRIVGYDLSHLGSGDHALYWSSSTATPVALKAMDANDAIAAFKINAGGEILGYSATAALPLYWSSATAIPHTLPVLPTQNSNFYIEGINAEGNIFVKGSNGLSSFYASPGAQPVLLPFLPGARNVNDSYYGAASINDHGIIVGTSPQGAQSGSNSAVRWLTTGGQVRVQDLNTLIPANSGWQLDEADFTNDNDTIIGKGRFNGVNTAFYLTPR